MREQHSTIIIGAGLSGLYTAWRLHQQGEAVLVLEARERIGGRILSWQPLENREACVDMGPAWVWPAFQPLLQGLITELNVPVFPQFTQGDMLYEVDARNVQRHGGPSSHNQSYRIAGGAVALVEKLMAQLPESAVHLNCAVKAIRQDPLEVHAFSAGEERVFSAQRIILAIPPRLLATSIQFAPAIDDAILSSWRSLPTWMAAHSKMLFVYDQPFWREQGLSGEVFSRYGPLTEIYDGSPVDESFYALTSFVGLNAHQRRQVSEQQLQDACIAQLERLFGAEARHVRKILSMDWSNEAMTSTDLDLQGIPHHPQYPDSSPRSLWDNSLILAGTEVAPENGGYLEGAIESANTALTMLNL